MRCRQARPLLPALVDDEPSVELARHLSSCERCSAELTAYRGMVARMAALNEAAPDAPAGFLERMLLAVPRAQARALRYALASVGGAALGAGAIGLVWWRLAHRAMRRATGAPELTGTAELAAS